MEDSQISGFDADTIIKATCLNMLVAGSDGITETLTWALSLLLNNRAMLDKVQEELDIQVGRNKNVDESDIKNLVFLQAVIKETLRLYPSGPINGLRSSLKDCTLSQGYHVPAGTRLMVNIWKIHHDENIWPEPYEFRPERFLTTHKDIDVKGQHIELIPFGSGRRSCPGIQLSLQTLHLCLATVLHCFDFTLPSNEKIDMSESIGFINAKATPLKSRRRVADIKGRSLPQPDGALPVIGHLLCFSGGKLIYKVFSDRPRLAASKLLGYDYAFFGVSPYGEYWREMRKIASLHLLSNRQVDMLNPIRTSEVETSIRELYELWVSRGNPKNGVMVDLQPWFVNLIRNMSVRMVGGKRLTEDGVDCNKE
nr:cytochrome P450 CYP82D47-like [Ipomoea batatas]